MNTSSIFLTILIVILGMETALGQTEIRLDVGRYDTNNQDASWDMMEVKSDNLTQYMVVVGPKDQQVIKAESNNAGGGLVYKKRIDP